MLPVIIRVIIPLTPTKIAATPKTRTKRRGHPRKGTGGNRRGKLLIK
jgi:hypothetical protein